MGEGGGGGAVSDGRSSVTASYTADLQHAGGADAAGLLPAKGAPGDPPGGEPPPLPPASRRACAAVAACAALTAGTLGYDVGMMADAADGISDDFGLSTAARELMVGSLNFVSAFGALAAGGAADWLGRRRAVLLCCLLYIVGTATMAAAPNFGVLLAGRVVTGIGVGVSFVVGPMYITEVVPAEVRGRYATTFDVAINAGILAGYVAGFVCVEVLSGPARWRALVAGGLVFPAAALALLPLATESPRWLLLRGDVDAASVALLRVTGDAGRAAATLAAAREEADRAARSGGGAAGWGDLLRPRTPALRRVIGTAVGIAFWQQATGSEAVLYYSQSFLTHAGLGDSGSGSASESGREMLLLGNVLVGLAKLLPEFWVMVSIDRRGRRAHLIGSSASMTVAIALLAGAFAARGTPVEVPPATVVALLCVFMATFSSGLGCIAFVAASEILPLHLRGKGMILVTFVNRIVSGAVALSALSIAAAVGEAAYFAIFAGVSLLSVRFFWRHVIETKGRSLEEVAVDAADLPDTGCVRAACIC